MTEPPEGEWSGTPCPECGAHTYFTSVNARPDLILLVCLDCGWEQEIPVVGATETRN